VTGRTPLSQRNRDLARALMNRGDLDVAFSERRPGPLAADPDVGELVLRAVPLDRPPDLLILNDDPPSFTRPAAGLVATWLHWEFGPPPRDWIQAAQLCSDEVWVDSQSMREWFLNAGLPEDRVVVIPLAVDHTRFGGPVPQAGRGDGFQFLFAGPLAHGKGADTLLEAYRTAFTRADDVTLLVHRAWGPRGPLDAVAEAMAADRSGPRVRLLDRCLGEADTARLHRSCHCLVDPHRGEELGVAVLQARAAGLPVIVPEHRVTRESLDPATAVLLPAARRVLPTLSDAEGRVLTGPPVVHEIAVADLAAGMRRLWADRAAAAAMGARAAEAVRGSHDPARAAEVVASRVHRVRVHA